MTAAQLAHRIERLNDEDEVRNLQHAYGFYIDRRMWSDVAELFIPHSIFLIRGVGNFAGPSGVLQALHLMGPENLALGILNDHPHFDTIVQINDNGMMATARSIEIGMIGMQTRKRHPGSSASSTITS